MLHDKTIGLIGAGNMAEAIMGGLLKAQLTPPEQVVCSDVQAERLQYLEKRYGVRTGTDNLAVIKRAEVVIFAVKPQIMGQVLNQCISALDPSKLIISIAAGVPMAAITSLSNQPLRVVRVMPNVCLLAQQGASAMVAGDHVQSGDLKLVETIFGAAGRCIQVASESLMDAVTGLSGSGPAYIFLLIEALADGGVKMGLGRQEALTLAAQTVLGAAQMYLDTGTHPGQLKDMVTSPGGTTMAGLHALEKGSFRGTVISAVESATQRSVQLGKK